MRAATRHLAVPLAVLALLVGGCAADDPTVEPPPEDADGAADPDPQAGPTVPPLLGGETGIDHWPESEVTFDDGAFVVAAKVADTPERRSQGLMRVPDLPDEVGMLFLFEDLRTGGFWMKDTLVPLDIAYIAGDEVVAIMQMEPCEQDPCPTYDPGEEYDATVEVRQGSYEEAGVDVGDRVTWTDPVERDAEVGELDTSS